MERFSNRGLAREFGVTESAVRRARATGRPPASLFDSDGRCADVAGARRAWAANVSRPPKTSATTLDGYPITGPAKFSVMRTRGLIVLGILEGGPGERFDMDRSQCFVLTAATAASLVGGIVAKLAQDEDDLPQG